MNRPDGGENMPSANVDNKSDKRSGKYMRWLTLGCCFLWVPLASSGCREHTVAADQSPLSVKIRAVESRLPSNGARYSAIITPQTQVEMAFKVGGYIEQILQVRGLDGRMRDLQEGDSVARGTVLARVGASDYLSKVEQAKASVAEADSSLEPARAQVAEADAALVRANLDFERTSKLWSSQSVTKTEYDAAKAQLEMSQARARSAAAQISVIEARTRTARATLHDASLPLQDTALRAPLNSIVLDKLVEVGTLVAAGKPGFVLADTSSVKAVFGVPDVTAAKLRTGSHLTSVSEALPGIRFEGQITRIAPAADPKSRVFEVEVTIPNPRQLLKPGLIASVELADHESPKPVTAAPLASIVRSKDKSEGYAVFVVREENGKQVARLRNVSLGEAFGNTIAVLDGLQLGEHVITAGATLVIDGQPVRVVP